jgi:hypothetical protein
MNKIYLKLKRDISILVADGNWSLHCGDMIVLQKIGTKSEIKRNEYKANEYIHSDSYLLTKFEYKTIEYKTIKDIMSMEYHTVWNECNSIDTSITISTGKPYYHSRTYTYYEIVKLNESYTSLVDNIKYDDVFEDVSITYNRENKLETILN